MPTIDIVRRSEAQESKKEESTQKATKGQENERPEAEEGPVVEWVNVGTCNPYKRYTRFKLARNATLVTCQVFEESRYFDQSLFDFTIVEQQEDETN